MNHQPQLEIVGSSHIKECNGAEYLALCQREKRGEIAVRIVEASFGKRWLWRVSYSVQKLESKHEIREKIF